MNIKIQLAHKSSPDINPICKTMTTKGSSLKDITMTDEFDYVIVGGGTAGSVLASRLKQGDSTLSILVIEAGPDVSDRPDVLNGAQWARLLGSELDWGYQTVPQAHLNGRVLANYAGKALGGGSAINAGILYPRRPSCCSY
jgi:choline dehydrogenase-like flavoprotein